MWTFMYVRTLGFAIQTNTKKYKNNRSEIWHLLILYSSVLYKRAGRPNTSENTGKNTRILRPRNESQVSVIFMKKDVSVLLRKIQLAKTQCLGQLRTLTRRIGRQMLFLDNAPSISTQYSKSEFKWGRDIFQRGQLDYICLSQTHRGASLYQRGHRDARQEMPGGQFGDKHFVFAGAFENNGW